MHPKALLDTCAELIAQTLTFQHPADATVARFFKEHRSLGPRERHTVSDRVYTVLREKPLLQAWVKRAPPALAEAYAAQGSPAAKGKTQRPPHSAHLLALLAGRHDADWLAAAATDAERAWIASCDQIDLAQCPPEARHLLPTWLADRLREQVGEGFDALAASLNEPATLDVRVNALLAKRSAVLARMAEEGWSATATPWSPMGIRLANKPSLNRWPLYLDGSVEVQDEGSQLLALLVDAKRNEMVMDFCAGAGGKTLALGVAMRNTGRLYALDTSAHRLEGLQPRLKRCGLSNVHPMAMAHEQDERLHRFIGKMDRVLVDAPCSGLGTLRRSPDLKWRQTPHTVAETAALQARILASAARLVKPGGRLVYATCSLLREENEAVADAFTAAHKHFVVVPVGDLLQRAGVEGAEGLTDNGCLRLWPHRHGTDGFFAAVWQRKP